MSSSLDEIVSPTWEVDVTYNMSIFLPLHDQ